MKPAHQIYHQRRESGMPQVLLPYKYKEGKSHTGMTSPAGLPLCLGLASALGLAAKALPPGRSVASRPTLVGTRTILANAWVSTTTAGCA
jgi:hypothetical protein